MRMNKMNITDNRLKEIIADELQTVLDKKSRSDAKKKPNTARKWKKIKTDKGKPSDTERKREGFNGYEDLQKLSKGIIPEAEDEIEEGNENFDADGRFTTPSKATCKSTYFQNGKRKSVNKSLSDKDDTGRGKNKHKGKGRMRCRDNEPLYESKWRQFTEELVDIESVSDERVNVPQDLYDAAKTQQKLESVIKMLRKKVEEAGKSPEKKCPLSYQDALKILNSLDKAKKGALFKPDTK